MRDLVSLAKLIEQTASSVRVVLDIPQLLHGEGIDPSGASSNSIFVALGELRPAMSKITGIHLWARSRRGSTHIGDLDEYFANRTDVKRTVLCGLGRLLDDGYERYFVPEINYEKSNSLEPMVADLVAAGFTFAGEAAPSQTCRIPSPSP